MSVCQIGQLISPQGWFQCQDSAVIHRRLHQGFHTVQFGTSLDNGRHVPVQETKSFQCLPQPPSPQPQILAQLKWCAQKPYKQTGCTGAEQATCCSEPGLWTFTVSPLERKELAYKRCTVCWIFIRVWCNIMQAECNIYVHWVQYPTWTPATSSSFLL